MLRFAELKLASASVNVKRGHKWPLYLGRRKSERCHDNKWPLYLRAVGKPEPWHDNKW
jgi:hypothetical protein